MRQSTPCTMDQAIAGLCKNCEVYWHVASACALRFKAKGGISALEYLTRWRMLLAGNGPANSEISVSTLAPTLGYVSERAFSMAFKRVMGCSPRRYSRGDRHTPPVRNEMVAGLPANGPCGPVLTRRLLVSSLPVRRSVRFYSRPRQAAP